MASSRTPPIPHTPHSLCRSSDALFGLIAYGRIFSPQNIFCFGSPPRGTGARGGGSRPWEPGRVSDERHPNIQPGKKRPEHFGTVFFTCVFNLFLNQCICLFQNRHFFPGSEMDTKTRDSHFEAYLFSLEPAYFWTRGSGLNFVGKTTHHPASLRPQPTAVSSPSVPRNANLRLMYASPARKHFAPSLLCKVTSPH